MADGRLDRVKGGGGPGGADGCVFGGMQPVLCGYRVAAPAVGLHADRLKSTDGTWAATRCKRSLLAGVKGADRTGREKGGLSR